jgi:hypothetical protein
MSTRLDTGTFREQVMTGVERIFEGDAEYIERLPEEAQNLVLIISARAMAEFCDANDGRHEAWGLDEATWARWIAHCRGLVAETEAMLGPWVADWIDGKLQV